MIGVRRRREAEFLKSMEHLRLCECPQMLLVKLFTRQRALQKGRVDSVANERASCML